MWRTLAVLLLCLPAATPARAIEPERKNAVIVTGRVWDGFGFKDMFLPSRSPTLHLLSGEDSAISFVETQEYYWPLSRQVYVDLEKKRQDVHGVLRITQNGTIVAELEPSPYVIVYPDGVLNGSGQLLWGVDANEAHSAYQREERTAARRYVAAAVQQRAYERKLLEAGAARLNGAPVEIIEPPDPLPKPSLRLVTEPATAYRLALSAGQYEMALIVSGKPVSDTRRRLDVVDIAGRRVTVAEVVPEERWTRPIATNGEHMRIFARPGSTFYLMLSQADRFDESEYLPVVSPQQDVVAGRSLWVRRMPSPVDSLAVRFSQNGDAQTVPLARLKVTQTEGSGFGYQVRAAKTGETEDLTAFAVSVPAGAGVLQGVVRSGGEGIGAFRRDVVVVQPRSDGLALGLALLPLLGWLGPKIIRRTAASAVADS
ncbi:hypothetical protein [Rhizobium giardinii]|uniref:Uncharacterized protein n=1 Tax=Rhizobium giardinii TaxID=56731 RepID=A0A7W8UAC0_9HYPH|nr:hypothetical protein [Rhizobium giardinii]MBB5535756.1 hypothetical protein [Rhizobium giardinii]